MIFVGLTHLLCGLLNPSPAKRFTVKDCQRDIWTNQPVDTSQYSWEEVLPNCGKDNYYKLLYMYWCQTKKVLKNQMNVQIVYYSIE